MIKSDKISNALRASNVDAIVASSPENVFHSSGMRCIATQRFAETAFSLWTKEGDGPFLIMPAREMSSLIDTNTNPAEVYPYGETNIYVGKQLSDVEQQVRNLQSQREFKSPVKALTTAIKENVSGKRINIEASGVTQQHSTQIQTHLDSYEVIFSSEQFQQLRRRKTQKEIDRLQRAGEITEQAIKESMEELEYGMTEKELADRFRSKVCKKGARPNFLTVGFGRRTAYTHPLPGDRELRDGDLVRWDAGCTYKNYCSDIGRTFAYGSTEERYKRIYQSLYEGLSAALDKVSDGASTKSVYEAGVEAIRSSDSEELSEISPFHLGHGIGVDIYDQPTITDADQLLEENMVMCVEPPYNKLGLGGFLIEDEIIVTQSGYEKITDSPPNLRVYG